MIEIFLSSTFGEFQQERDWIKTYVQPQLTQYAKEQFAETVHFIDYRWGIVTNQKNVLGNNEKVLRVCLDRIEHSQIFLGILGDTYGSVMEQQSVRKVLQLKQIPFTRDYADISVTHLEFLYSISRPDMRRIFCLQKNTPSTEPTVRRLKKHLRTKYLDGVLEYEASNRIEFYTHRILDALKQQITFLCQNKRQTSRLERTVQQMESVGALLQRSLPPAAMQRAVSMLESAGQNTLLVLRGDDGIGKSTCIAALDLLMQTQQIPHVTVYAGDENLCGNQTELLQYLYSRMNITIPSDAGFEQMCAGLQNITAPIYLLLDDADKLVNHDAELFGFLPAYLPKGTHLIMTCSSRCSLPIRLPFHPRSVVLTVNGLNDNEIPDTISAILARYGKELPPFVTAAIQSREQSTHPMYIDLILQRYQMLEQEDFRAIGQAGTDYNQSQQEYFLSILDNMPQDLARLSSCIIDTACRQFPNPDVLHQAIVLLALTKNGLRAADLDGILQNTPGWNPLDFRVLTLYVDYLFRYTAEQHIVIPHASLRRLITDQEDNLMLLLQLMEWLDQLPHADAVKQNEYIRLCFLTGEADRLAYYLNDVYSDEAALSALIGVLSDDQILSKVSEMVEAVPRDDREGSWMEMLCAALTRIPMHQKERLGLVADLLEQIRIRADEPSQSKGFDVLQALEYCSVTSKQADFTANVLRDPVKGAELYDSICDIYSQLLDCENDSIRELVQVNMYIAMKKLAFCYNSCGKKEASDAVIKLAKVFAEHLNLFASEPGNDILLSMAVLNSMNDNYTEAQSQFLEVIRELEALPNQDDDVRDKLSTAYHNMGSACFDAEEYAEAMEYYIKAAEASPHSLDSGFNLSLLDNMARCHEALGDPEKGLALFRQTLEGWLQLAVGESNGFFFTKVYKAYQNIADILLRMGRTSESADSIREGLSILADMVCSSSNEADLELFTKMLHGAAETWPIPDHILTCALKVLNSDHDPGCNSFKLLAHEAFGLAYRAYANSESGWKANMEQLEAPLRKAFQAGNSVSIGARFATVLETLGDTDSDNAPEYLREACEINLFLAAEQKDRPEFLAFGVSCLAQCLDALGEEAYSRRNLAALLDCFSNVYEALLDADKICLDQAYQSTFENSMELIEEWLECLRLGEHAAVLRYCQNKVIFGDNAD